MYFKKRRWVSIWCQIEEIIKSNPKNVLDVGAGNGLLGFFLKMQTNIEYKSLDINKGEHIDVVADAKNIPFEEKSFDTVCSFQTLEHMKYEDALIALKEIRRVSKQNVIISLPHSGRYSYINIKLPFIKKIKYLYFQSSKKDYSYNGMHYWELGTKQVSVNKFINDSKKIGLKLKKEFNVFENPYHHFFIFEKINKKTTS